MRQVTACGRAWRDRRGAGSHRRNSYDAPPMHDHARLVAELGADVFMLHLYAALTEKERRLIAERTKAGSRSLPSTQSRRYFVSMADLGRLL